MYITALWIKYQENRTNEHRNDLVTHYLPLARLHAHRAQKKVAKYLSTEEILGAASVGLIQAVEAFDPNRKLKFETFSGHRIRGAILDWLRDIDTQSRTVRFFEKKRRMVSESLAQNGFYDEARIAEEMGITYERYAFLSGKISHSKHVPLSVLTVPNYRGVWNAEDKSSPDPTRTISRSLLREFISKGLSRVSRMIIILYYFEDLTMREIGEVLDLSESRVSQMRAQAILLIRGKLESTIFEHEKLLLT